MLDELNLGVPNFGGTYQDSQGKERPLGISEELKIKFLERINNLGHTVKVELRSPDFSGDYKDAGRTQCARS